MNGLKCIIGLGLLACAHWAYADKAMQAEADYRHHVMEAVGGLTASMGDILKKGVHEDDLVIHARALAMLAEVVPHTFPEGSLTEDSEALPAIWEDPEGFSQAMDKFVAAAEQMAKAAATKNIRKILPAISELGESCKGCHDSYKAD